MEVSEELSVKEAAKMAGVASSTVRRWIDTNKLPSNRNREGWRRVRKKDLMEYLASGVVRVARPLSGATVSDHVRGARGSDESTTVSLLKDALDRERGKVDKLEERNKQLQDEILKLTHEIKAILSKENQSLLSRWIRT